MTDTLSVCSLPAENYPHLDYLAPEYALLGTVTPAADLYSLGMLALAVYNKKPLFQTNRNWGTFRRQAAELKSLPSARLEAVSHPYFVDFVSV